MERSAYASVGSCFLTEADGSCELTSSFQVLPTERMRAVRHPEFHDYTTLVMVRAVEAMIALFRGVYIADQLLADTAAEHNFRSRDVAVACTRIGVLPWRHCAFYVS